MEPTYPFPYWNRTVTTWHEHTCAVRGTGIDCYAENDRDCVEAHL